MNKDKTFNLGKRIFSIIVIMLFMGLISCGDDTEYYHYDWVTNDVEHKADMPVIQYYMDSLREDFKDSLILMGYDEDSIDISDSITFHKQMYWGGVGYEGDSIQFDTSNHKGWQIIAKVDESVYRRKKECAVRAEIKAVMQDKKQIRNREYVSIILTYSLLPQRSREYVSIYIKDFTAELEGAPVKSEVEDMEALKLGFSKGLKYRVEFDFKGEKNWQEGQVDFFETQAETFGNSCNLPFH